MSQGLGLRRSRYMPYPFGARSTYPRRFRRLLSIVAPASQPSCRHLIRTSNAPRHRIQTVQPFAPSRLGSALRFSELLWPRLTSVAPLVRLSTDLAKGRAADLSG